MDIKCFAYKNTFIQIQETKTITNAVCFCCGKEIDKHAIALINEQHDIPDIMLHETCVAEQSNNLPDLYNDICIAFEQYKKLDKIFRI